MKPTRPPAPRATSDSPVVGPEEGAPAFRAYREGDGGQIRLEKRKPSVEADGAETKKDAPERVSRNG